MEKSAALELISRAIANNTLANGYLIVGDVATTGKSLVMNILHLLFPAAIEQINLKTHPDVVWLEPEGKSRTIHADSMRERIVEPMSVTAFSGGWKVGVVVGADRLEPAAANAFLKSLEEPTAHTLYLLLTDQPDAILPTIISRTQRLDLGLTDDGLDDDTRSDIAEIFEASSVKGFYEKAQAAKRLAEILGALKDSVADEEVALIRKAFYKIIMNYVRDWMVDGRLAKHLAFRNVVAVEDAYSRSERSMNDEAVLGMMMDQLTFP